MKEDYYIGRDVHKDTVAIACAVRGSRVEPEYEGERGGSNLSVEWALRKLAKNLGVRLRDLNV